jgi:hypothetical protein
LKIRGSREPYKQGRVKTAVASKVVITETDHRWKNDADSERIAEGMKRERKRTSGRKEKKIC